MDMKKEKGSRFEDDSGQYMVYYFRRKFTLSTCQPGRMLCWPVQSKLTHLKIQIGESTKTPARFTANAGFLVMTRRQANQCTRCSVCKGHLPLRLRSKTAVYIAKRVVGDSQTTM